MNRLSAVLIALSSAPLILVLQGCGGDGGSTTTTTTLYIPPRTKPLAEAKAMKYLNDQYMGFSETDPTSPLGVTISMAAQTKTFFGNVFCSTFSNPDGNTGCFRGGADCRMSASLYNHKMIVSAKDGKPLIGLSRSVGIVFNQSRVEEVMGKCSYVWDGASQNRYNNGCGDGAQGASCDVDTCAYKNQCSSSGTTCVANDIEVTRAICDDIPGYTGPAGDHPVPSTHSGGAQCLFPGAAFAMTSETNRHDFKPSRSWMREMTTLRMRYNDGYDKLEKKDNIEQWNEVVIDEHIMLPDLWEDPALVIPAIVYTKSQEKIALQEAKAMRDDLCSKYFVSDIPIIAIEDTQVLPDGTGPFVLPPAGSNPADMDPIQQSEGVMI